jgi:hypothetical protein
VATSTLIPFDSVAIGLDSPVHSTAAAGYSARNHGIQVISLSFSEGHLRPRPELVPIGGRTCSRRCSFSSWWPAPRGA